jgi:Recombinase
MVGHSGAMVEDGKKPAGGPGLSGSQVVKRRAELNAAAFASTIRELRSAGFVTRRALVAELNRRGTLTARGGRWHYTTIVRMLMHLGLATSGNGMVNNGKANKRAADVRAESLGPTIRKLRKAGFVSMNAIARELNERGIATARGGKWRPAGVSQLLHRLKRLEPSSHIGVSPASDAEPK